MTLNTEFGENNTYNILICMDKIKESPQVIVIHNRIDNSNEGLLSKTNKHTPFAIISK